MIRRLECTWPLHITNFKGDLSWLLFGHPIKFSRLAFFLVQLVCPSNTSSSTLEIVCAHKMTLLTDAVKAISGITIVTMARVTSNRVQAKRIRMTLWVITVAFVGIWTTHNISSLEMQHPTPLFSASQGHAATELLNRMDQIHHSSLGLFDSLTHLTNLGSQMGWKVHAWRLSND